MLIIGGSFPLSTDCDVPSQFGTHNLDLGEQNAKKEPWQLFNPNLTTYAVPDAVIKAVGGGKDGGATKREPEKGWAHPDLKVLLTREAKFPERTATRSVPSATSTSDPKRKGKALSKGAIAGIAVGGAVAIAAALVGVCWFIRRHRQRRIQDEQSRKGKPLADGVGLGTVTPASDVPPWSPGLTATTGYTPTSPYSDGHSQRQQHEGSMYSVNVPRPPAELEGNTYWQGPDGVTYELTSPGTAVSEQHQQGLQTKVDSQGRVWMQVHQQQEVITAVLVCQDMERQQPEQGQRPARPPQQQPTPIGQSPQYHRYTRLQSHKNSVSIRNAEVRTPRQS